MPSRRSLAKLAALATVLLASALAQAGAAAAAPLSIKVEGNHFVNGDGQTVRLLGVNHPSFEYACQFGYGYDDGHMDDADAAAIAAWNASAVRVPLNEDCWLGLNGLPSNAGGPPQPLTAAGYQQAVKDYVAALGAHGLYAILDLHWTSPDTPPTPGQRAMPDGRSAAFWASVATSFKDNPAVVFDLFNEPYSPAAVNDPAHPVGWSCWRDGGCLVPVSSDLAAAPSKTLYPAVGMQALVDAVRATGATQPIMLGGLDYANDLTQWLANKPSDPLNQLAASFHNYQGEACDNANCWNSTIASVAGQVPVVSGEFDQDVCAPSNFDEDYMTWSDQHGVGYLAWGWWVLTPQEIADAGCSAFFLLTDYNGTPAAPNGTAVHDHLLRLPPRGIGTAPPAPAPTAAAGTRTPIRLTRFRAQVKPGGSQVSFTLSSSVDCLAVLTGTTAKRYAPASASAKPKGKPKRRRISLGTVRFSLEAGKQRTVVLNLSKRGASLLAAKHRLKASFTVTLTNSASARTVLQRVATLKLPAPPRRHHR
ncbi:MAG: glycoside hydrolase family 5 protein [Solirubrobacterales bacterium]